MDQVIQVAGALMILVAFAANQRGAMRPYQRSYLWLNFVGSAILSAIAILNRDAGFILLESVWAAVSLWGLVQIARGRGDERPN